MDLDMRLCAHLKKDVADLSSWLPAYNAVVEQRLSLISWQSWGSDNQIIASVQTLVDECALALERAQPEWTDAAWQSSARSSGASDRTSIREELSTHLSRGFLGCLCWPGQAPGGSGGRLLIICASDECGGPARLIQRRLEDELQCEVVIGSNDVGTWRGEVDSATRGVMLLQTRSVLRDPMRLLQLFEATRKRHPLVCVNVVGGGYDFAKVKPLLLSLSNELHPGEMATLRAELLAQGNGVGQLGSTLSDAICHTISVFFNPAASDVVMEAAIKDILDKLERGAELLQTKAIPVTVLPSFSRSFSRRFKSPSAPTNVFARTNPPALTTRQEIDFPDAPPMPHSSRIGLGQLVSSGGALVTDLPASNLDNLDHLVHNLATREDRDFELKRHQGGTNHLRAATAGSHATQNDAVLERAGSHPRHAGRLRQLHALPGSGHVFDARCVVRGKRHVARLEADPDQRILQARRGGLAPQVGPLHLRAQRSDAGKTRHVDGGLLFVAREVSACATLIIRGARDSVTAAPRALLLVAQARVPFGTLSRGHARCELARPKARSAPSAAVTQAHHGACARY
eukprot:scaffold43563_cov69-Phaeocystis_antarctica.AAC.4